MKQFFIRIFESLQLGACANHTNYTWRVQVNTNLRSLVTGSAMVSGTSSLWDPLGDDVRPNMWISGMVSGQLLGWSLQFRDGLWITLDPWMPLQVLLKICRTVAGAVPCSIHTAEYYPIQIGFIKGYQELVGPFFGVGSVCVRAALGSTRHELAAENVLKLGFPKSFQGIPLYCRLRGMGPPTNSCLPIRKSPEEPHLPKAQMADLRPRKSVAEDAKHLLGSGKFNSTLYPSLCHTDSAAVRSRGRLQYYTHVGNISTLR